MKYALELYLFVQMFTKRKILVFSLQKLFSVVLMSMQIFVGNIFSTSHLLELLLSITFFAIC